MRLLAPLVVALLLAACTGSASARSTSTLDGYGLSVTLDRGWHGVAHPGQLQADTFHSRETSSPQLSVRTFRAATFT